jgi:hypothetical protein
MINARCLTDDDLLAMAFDAGTPDSATLQHIAECDCCEDRLVRLLHAAHALTVAAGASVPDARCLTDGQLAELTQGEVSPDQAVLSHLTVCGECSSMLASLVRLLDDPQIKADMHQVDRPHAASHRRMAARATAGAATLAAALFAGLILLPDAVPDRAVIADAAPHRQSVSATEIVPRIIASTIPNTLPDTLRWTSVPFADRYRVLMFDRDGTLAWEAQTRDTAIALPQRLRTEAAAYLWKVEARTDWNRWVASEWAELAIPRRP